MIIKPISTLKDNYVWCMMDGHQAVIVDPGEALPVLDYLKTHSLMLRAILITHHHWDHTNGVDEILKNYKVPVYKTENLDETMPVEVPDFPIQFKVFNIPGHTLDHIAYYTAGMLFCGDTLFSAGCGRLFEGTITQLFTSLQTLAKLPDETKVYSAHEYTLNNLRFAETVEPNNAAIRERMEYVKKLRDQGLPSLPSTIKIEKLTNPFLRCHSPEIKISVEKYCGKPLHDEIEVFAALRKWKDVFK